LGCFFFYRLLERIDSDVARISQSRTPARPTPHSNVVPTTS
jgi:hypothetical protein